MNAISDQSRIVIGFKTDRGLLRPKNEDSLRVDKKLGLLIVADGMGGHRAGEVASAIAVDEIAYYVENNLSPGKDVAQILTEAVTNAHWRIFLTSKFHPELSGMGTTVVMALAQGNRVLVTHVGDSRAYMVRNGAIKQLTNDHTFVAEWVREGSLTPEQARHHQGRHGLFMAMGMEDEIHPETNEWLLDDGSCLLLSSDGLHDMIEEDDILEILQKAETPQQACDDLVRRANEAGGEDNISVVVACWEPVSGS